jgi:hypothetical protein
LEIDADARFHAGSDEHPLTTLAKLRVTEDNVVLARND